MSRLTCSFGRCEVQPHFRVISMGRWSHACGRHLAQVVKGELGRDPGRQVTVTLLLSPTPDQAQPPESDSEP